MVILNDERFYMKLYDVGLISGIYIAQTDAKGLGVYSSINLKKGTIIETCPVVFFDKEDQENIDKTYLYNYYFAPDFLKNPDNKAGCFAMGTMSICNHRDNPNAEIEKITKNGVTHFVLKAIDDITAGDEITISYGFTWFDVSE